MTLPDFINGCFEAGGGAFQILNCWRIWRDKQVRGVSVLATGMFTSWGFWNLYYYPHLDQWLSFSGGIVIVSANAVWVALAICYTRRERLIRHALRNMPPIEIEDFDPKFLGDMTELAEIERQLANAGDWGARLTPLIERRNAILRNYPEIK